MAVESSEDDDMPSLLDEKSEGSGNDEPQKRASATREKKTSKTSMKTPRSPAQVEESAEVKAQKRLEAKAIHMLEDILADTAQIKENSEVVKSYIAAAKDLEAEITLSLAQRNRKTPQDALNLHLTQLQHAHPQLELRLTHLIATEKENKRKQAEQKEVGRKEKDIARKKATAEAKKKKAKVKHDEEERLRTEQEELDASVKRALDEQKEQKRRAELDDTERKTLLRWNGSCSVVQFMCERLPAMPVATWEKQRKVHNGQCPICIEDFDEGERVWRMPCAHAACEDCLEPYLKPFIDTSAAVGGKGQSAYAYAMCALCRAAFDPEEQKAADLAQSEDRGRREQENAPPTPQANVTIWAAPRTANVAPPLRGSDAVFHPLGITALAEGSQAGGSTPLTPETVPDVSATLFCAGLSDVFCGTDGRRSVAKRRRPDSGRAGVEPATYG